MLRVEGESDSNPLPPSCTTDNVIILLFDLKYQYFQVYSILNHFKHERSVEFTRPNFTVNNNHL